MPTPTLPRPAPEETTIASGSTARVLPFEAPLRKWPGVGAGGTAEPTAEQPGENPEHESDNPGSRPRVRETAEAATQDATLVLDDGGHVRWFSPAARHVFRYAAQRLLGVPIRALLPELPRHARTPGYNAAFVAFRFPGETARQLRAIDGEGRPFAVDVSVGVVRADRRPCFVLALRRRCDPTATSLDLRRLLEAIEDRADAIAITDPAGAGSTRAR